MKNFIQRSFWLCIVLFICSLATWGAYALIGSRIDSQGFLQEPFALIPITWLLFFASLIIGGINVIARLVQARRKTANN